MILRTEDLRKKFANVGPLRVAHYDEGEGPPILLIHGIPTSCYLWRKVIPALVGSHRVIAPDLLGLGDTGGPIASDYSMPAQVEMLVGLLDAKGIDRVHVVGHDQGGAAAQIFATSHSDRTDRLILTNCVAYDNWPVPIIRALQLTAHSRGLFHALASTRVGERIVRSRIGYQHGVHDRANLPQTTIDEYLRPTHDRRRATPDRYVARERLRRFTLAGDCAYTQAIAPALRKFDHPTLVVWGRNDRFIPLRWGQKLADEIGGAGALEEIDACGHFSPEDQPEALAAHITRFFAP